MKKDSQSRFIFLTGAIALAGAFFFGTWIAFSKGANDFQVFYEAWHLVLSGRGNEIYRVSPDRFLYGPGFAWILSPLAILPKNFALAIWCAAKIYGVVWIAWKLSQWLNSRREDFKLSLGLSLWGVLLVMRPLIIDFSYGQVNLFILSACVWVLLGHFDESESRFWDWVRWCVLTWVAISKLFPLPLLLTPWLVKEGISPPKRQNEKIGIFLGVLLVFVPPLLSLGFAGTWQLMSDWRDALISRGLPLESHNQSFTALLYHYWSGYPTRILAEGSIPLILGSARLSVNQIALLSLFWTTTTLGFVLGWICSGSKHTPLKWSMITIALLIVPSHLIWKPYFVMSIPLTVLVIHRLHKNFNSLSFFIVTLLFIGINLTGFDFVGHSWAAYLEASSMLLFIHLILIVLVARGDDSLSKIGGVH